MVLDLVALESGCGTSFFDTIGAGVEGAHASSCTSACTPPKGVSKLGFWIDGLSVVGRNPEHHFGGERVATAGIY